MGSPRTRDNKSVVTIYPATEGWSSWFTSRGDNLSPPERGTGTPIDLEWTTIEPRGEKYCELQFIEPVEIHDGEAYYKGDWSKSDLVNMSINVPGNTTIPNPGGTGNCNRIPTGLGYDLIVPAYDGGGNPNGAYDIDLSQAVPVPTAPGSGQWDCNYESGVIAPPVTPSEAAWMLISVPAPPVYSIRNIALGSPLGLWDIDTYKVEWVHPRWVLKISVNKQSLGAGEFTGWILVYRRNRT